jgi:hypothetical protein
MTDYEKKIRGKTYRLYEHHCDKKLAEGRAKTLGTTFGYAWDVKASPIPDSKKSAFKWGVWVRRK